MKKIILFIILLLCLPKYSFGKMRKGKLVEKTTLQKIQTVYTVINNNIDSILTTNGAIKTMILLAPFFVLYCHYFNTDPIQSLVNKIVRSVGKAEELYRIQKEIGKTEAIWGSIKNCPWPIISMTIKNILHKTFYSGFPFAISILFKNLLSIKKS